MYLTNFGEAEDQEDYISIGHLYYIKLCLWFPNHLMYRIQKHPLLMEKRSPLKSYGTRLFFDLKPL